MFRSDLFKGHKILVTGGGTGLGKVMAERLLQRIIANRIGQVAYVQFVSHGRSPSISPSHTQNLLELLPCVNQ